MGARGFNLMAKQTVLNCCLFGSSFPFICGGWSSTSLCTIKNIYHYFLLLNILLTNQLTIMFFLWPPFLKTKILWGLQIKQKWFPSVPQGWARKLQHCCYHSMCCYNLYCYRLIPMACLSWSYSLPARHWKKEDLEKQCFSFLASFNSLFFPSRDTWELCFHFSNNYIVWLVNTASASYSMWLGDM